MDRAQPPVERRIDVADRAFRLLTTARSGAGHSASRPTYVLVHGIGMSHRYFRRLTEQLIAVADVITVDLPGYAGLPKPGDNITVEAMATALGQALDDVVTSPVILVGHSMGAQWVIELGVQRPDLVAGVVAIGPVSDDRHRSVHAQAIALGIDAFGESPAANAIVFGDYLRSGLRWYLKQVQHMVAYPIEDRAAQLEAPLLVMRGGSDPIAGEEWCRRLRDRARDGSFVSVPAHNHVAQWTAPRSVASAIEAFVASRVRRFPDSGRPSVGSREKSAAR